MEGWTAYAGITPPGGGASDTKPAGGSACLMLKEDSGAARLAAAARQLPAAAAGHTAGERPALRTPPLTRPACRSPPSRRGSGAQSDARATNPQHSHGQAAGHTWDRSLLRASPAAACIKWDQAWRPPATQLARRIQRPIHPHRSSPQIRSRPRSPAPSPPTHSADAPSAAAGCCSTAGRCCRGAHPGA
jgi:hypothetical protein